MGRHAKQLGCSDAQLAEMYREKGSANLVAKELNVSNATVIKHLRAHGVEVKKGGYRSYDRQNQRKTDRNQQLTQRFFAGESPQQLMKDYGISRARLYQILDNHKTLEVA